MSGRIKTMNIEAERSNMKKNAFGLKKICSEMAVSWRKKKVVIIVRGSPHDNYNLKITIIYMLWMDDHPCFGENLKIFELIIIINDC